MNGKITLTGRAVTLMMLAKQLANEDLFNVKVTEQPDFFNQ